MTDAVAVVIPSAARVPGRYVLESWGHTVSTGVQLLRYCIHEMRTSSASLSYSRTLLGNDGSER